MALLTVVYDSLLFNVHHESLNIDTVNLIETWVLRFVTRRFGGWVDVDRLVSKWSENVTDRTSERVERLVSSDEDD